MSTTTSVAGDWDARERLSWTLYNAALRLNRGQGLYAEETDALAHAVLATGWRPGPRVITGDIPTVTAALDALPAGTVIRIVEEEDGPQVFEAVVAHGHHAPPIVWSSTRSPGLVDSGYIARGETPVTVLWAGETP